ncbi:MAG: hypothetical protein K2N05_12530 [Muribaculaceae bacterium]|nr:hypothetical protein [Muribaculaceae bacterium]
MNRIVMIMVLAAIFNISSIYGQDRMSVVKKIKGIEYKFEIDRSEVRRANRPTYRITTELGKDYELDKNEIIPNTMKKILGKKRLEELKKRKILLKFVCDSNGKVKDVVFLSSTKGIPFTDIEIYKLEKEFLKQQFPIIKFADKEKLGDLIFVYPVTLSKLVE